MSVRLAVITDLHYGRDTGNVKGPEALTVLNEITSALHGFEPDAVVDLGDRLTDENPEVDRARLLEVARVFKRLPYPRHHLLGNHDTLPRHDQEAILDTNLGNHSVTMGDWTLLFLESFDGTIGGALRSETIAWLEGQLSAASHPVVVFSHQPLHGEWMQGNPYFEDDFRLHACAKNAEAARRAMESSAKVCLCVAGHAHWSDHRRVNGIPYITVMSATESHWTPGQPSRAWALLELGHTVRLEVFGLAPAVFEL